MIQVFISHHGAALYLQVHNKVFRALLTIFTGSGSEVEVKVLVAVCTDVDVYNKIWAYKVTVDSK
jgi:hypothetical protein